MKPLYVVGLCRVHPGPTGIRFCAHQEGDPQRYVLGSVGGYKRALEAAAEAMCMSIPEYRRYLKRCTTDATIDVEAVPQILEREEKRPHNCAVIYHIYPNGLMLGSGRERL